MTVPDRSRYEARARVVKAMAHPTRLFLVEMLSLEELCVRDLTERVGVDVSTVSRHLSVLKGVGIVADERRGSNVFYRLRLPCVLGFFSCVESVLSGDESPGKEGGCATDATC